MINYANGSFASIVYPAWQWFETSEFRSLTILVIFALLFASEALCSYRSNSPKTTRQSYMTNLGTLWSWGSSRLLCWLMKRSSR